MARTGNAPCVGCSLFAKGVRLTGRVESDGVGGEWHECEAGQFCIQCGEPWRWLHVPLRLDLLMPVREREEVMWDGRT